MKPLCPTLALFCLLLGAIARAEPYQIVSEEWAPYNYQQGDQLRQAPQITTRHAGLIPQLLESRGFDNLEKRATSSQQPYRMLLAGRTGIIVGDTDAGVACHSAQLGTVRCPRADARFPGKHVPGVGAGADVLL